MVHINTVEVLTGYKTFYVLQINSRMMNIISHLRGYRPPVQGLWL